jgi:membrane protein DedA with SNARE-associated domain
MELGALLGLVGLLFVKEAGVPIPIPGDLLVLGAGVAAAANAAVAPIDLAAILGAGFLGGSLQFLLVRGALRGPLLAVLARVGVPRDRLDRLADWLRRRGPKGVAIARATPGVRIGAISASGIAALPFPAFLAGLVAGNSLFVGGHFALGFLVGAPALEVIRELGAATAGVIAVAALAVLGAVGWAWIGRRRRSRADVAGSAVGDWADAACPACLGIGLLSRVDPDNPPMIGSA